MLRERKGDDKEIVQLHKQGKSFREIGRLLGISHVAVHKRYMKATRNSRVSDEATGPAEQLTPPEEKDSKADGSGGGRGNLTKPDIAEDGPVTKTKSAQVPVEPKYYKHISTGQLFHRNEITEAMRSQVEAYYPPNYLRKTSEPNKGGIYACTCIG